ncbi:30S ribosomal protein S5 [Candidatus Saccharibacteria bacterium]|jgi:small subunit ribosomal protein S5|nr:30S ribosomal protein S5 [Candidatus Saccharibacteria bacterium]
MDDRKQSEYEENVIAIDRVTRVVAGGRRFRFRALVVVGNGKGRVGVGIAKGADVQLAVQKAVNVAKKKLIDVPLYNSTIPHRVTAKMGGAEILLIPASPGTGVKAGGTVRKVLDVSGIHNVMSKSIGSSNKVNVAYATIKALQMLVPQEDWVTYDKDAKKDKSNKKSNTEKSTETTDKPVKKAATDKKASKKTEVAKTSKKDKK